MKKKYPEIIKAIFTGWLVAGIFCVNLYAVEHTNPLSHFNLKVWQTQDGLPQNAVQAVEQTLDGYIWLGTDAGLVRFDGVNFRVFNKANTQELKSNSILALEATRDGMLWIGTEAGVYCYHNGVFKRYSTTDGLAHDIARVIFQDKTDNIWVGTDKGLSRFVENSRFLNLTEQDGLTGKKVLTLNEDSSGVLWIGTNKGVNSLHNGDLKSFTVKDGLANFYVLSIQPDNSGSVWIGTANGLSRLQDGSVYNYTEKDGLPPISIKSIFLDNQNKIWVGTLGNGLYRLEKNRFVSYAQNNNFPDDVVEVIIQDREGSIWVGTDNGLVRMVANKFVNLTKLDGLLSENVQSVYAGSSGTVWVGTLGGGVTAFNGSERRTITTKQGLVSNFVQTVYETRNNDVWVGTKDGLHLLKNGQIKVFKMSDGLSSNFIRVIFEDSKGRLWFGTDSGLNVFENNEFRVYKTESGLSSGSFRTIVEDLQGNIWIGTDNGLNRFNGETFDSFTTKDGLAHPMVWSLYPDADGSLWIGTKGGGLSRFANNSFVNLTSKDGLHSEDIYKIIDDGRGSLWISCSNGVFRLSKNELKEFTEQKRDSVSSTIYNVSDGMLTTQFNGGTQPAGVITANGQIYFASVKGLVAFNPQNFQINQVPPPVLISELRAGSNSYTGNSVISLDPSLRKLEIHYSGLSFVAPDKVRFKYQLEGYDKEWIDAGTRRTAYYTNLPPGNYNFKVIASNNDGIWNEEGAKLKFTLEHGFFETPIPYLLGTLFLGLMIWSVHRIRVRRVAETYRLVFEERTRIARELHDTLEQKLVGIGLQLDVLSKLLLEKPAVALQHLEMARKLVSHSQSEAKRSVWDLRPEVLEENDLPTALSETAHQLIAGAKTSLDFKVSGTPKSASALIENNLLRIGQEALTNATKHAAPEKISIYLTYEPRSICLKVIDDGKGFIPQNGNSAAKGHFGLLGMHERAKRIGGKLNIHSVPEVGTTIEVTVPYK